MDQKPWEKKRREEREKKEEGDSIFLLRKNA